MYKILFKFCTSSYLTVVLYAEIYGSFNYSLIKGINRGSLLYPFADIAHVVLKSYIVVQKITEHDKFFQSHLQHALAINTVMAVLEDDVLLDLYTLTLARMAVFQA